MKLSDQNVYPERSLVIIAVLSWHGIIAEAEIRFWEIRGIR